MMLSDMPHERSPVASGAPDNGAHAPLRVLAERALRHAAGGPREAAGFDGAMRHMIRVTCQLAHEQGLHAEALLILLKQTWRTMPDVRQLRTDEASELLTRVITLCVDEFYRVADRER